tara:strand:+ start:2666 stop:3520 length:855 start_codon:yes stop_codon:yes gene_type:complete
VTEPGTGRHIASLTFDLDTVSIWMAQGQTSPTMMSRGEFGIVGAERIMRLLSDEAIKGTFYVPGRTLEAYPDTCRALHAEGHELAHHGFDHVSPVNLSRDEELDQLRRGNALIGEITGTAASGYRSPAWDLSPNSVELLLGEGFSYDSSMMAHDSQPYLARSGDAIDGDGRFRPGQETSLVELPISWSLDDFPHFEYFRGGGLRAASGVLENWLADFDYMVRFDTWGALTFTCHPFVVGRGHRMLMLESLIHGLKARGAAFLTAADLVQEHRLRARATPAGTVR